MNCKKLSFQKVLWSVDRCVAFAISGTGLKAANGRLVMMVRRLLMGLGCIAVALSLAGVQDAVAADATDEGPPSFSTFQRPDADEARDANRADWADRAGRANRSNYADDAGSANTADWAKNADKVDGKHRSQISGSGNQGCSGGDYVSWGMCTGHMPAGVGHGWQGKVYDNSGSHQGYIEYRCNDGSWKVVRSACSWSNWGK